MKITSPAFSSGQKIPAKYTCDGERISPPLIFSGMPKEAKSLVLIMDDIDMPKSHRSDGVWNHWLVWNMPPETKGIGEGMVPPGVRGHTTGGETEYQGPCPPDTEHRYCFRLLALDTMLDLDTKKTRREDLLKIAQSHLLAQSELMGKYLKKRKRLKV